MKKSEQCSKEAMCPICMEIPIDTTVQCCPHSFCYDCIYRWAKRKQTCPICRRIIRKLFHNRKTIPIKRTRGPAQRPRPVPTIARLPQENGQYNVIPMTHMMPSIPTAYPYNPIYPNYQNSYFQCPTFYPNNFGMYRMGINSMATMMPYSFYNFPMHNMMGGDATENTWISFQMPMPQPTP